MIDPETEGRYVEFGRLAPVGECRTCDACRVDEDRMMPNHRASESCESGRRAHCTCDTCY